MANENPKKPPGEGVNVLPPSVAARGDLASEVVRDGVVFPWMVSERAIQAVRDYDVRDDDVWITTYPKAGTIRIKDDIFSFILLIHNDTIEGGQN